MKRILSSSVLVLGLAACAGKPDEPRVQFGDVGLVLHLPAAMRQAADSLAPGFKVVRADQFRSDVSQLAAQDAGTIQALFALVADFDGDGTPDAVEEGTIPGDTALRVIAILNGAKPRAMYVARYPVFDADAVGIYLSLPRGSPNGTFQVVNYPDSSASYQLKDAQFVLVAPAREPL